MIKNVIPLALAALLFLPLGAARAQNTESRGDAATVVGLYVEQAPGVLADVKLLRNRGGRQWAEIRRDGAADKVSTELIRIPSGVTLNAGDRVLVAARGESSASVGSSSPSRVPIEPYLERPLDLTGLRTPVTRPLAVVPGSCVPF